MPIPLWLARWRSWDRVLKPFGLAVWFSGENFDRPDSAHIARRYD